MDLFASRLNFQILCYVSCQPDPLAWKTDAFSIPWTNLKAFCVPTIQPNICCSSESVKGQSSINTDNSLLEDSTMVSTGSSSVLQESNSSPCGEQHVNTTVRQKTDSPVREDSQINRVDSMRRRYITRGFLNKTAEILSKAWRTKTNKQYQSAWKLWLGWCGRRVPPFRKTHL